jgi:CheY-like chemotaxis protein
VSSLHKLQILVVDDDASVRETIALILSTAGYDTSTASDGLEALVQFKTSVPDLLLCDLEMPRMSGFELLCVVRRRFPEIAVVAMSGLYEGDAVPDEVVADAFYPKGRSQPERLFHVVLDAVRAAKARLNASIRDVALVWARHIGKDAGGTPYVVVPCTQCLRSFLLASGDETNITVKEIQCVFCLSDIRFVTGSGAYGLPHKNRANNVASIGKPAGSIGVTDNKLRAAAKSR